MEIRRFSKDLRSDKHSRICSRPPFTLEVSLMYKKSSYLIRYLEGDSSNVISGLAPTSQNYTQVLELLEKRFAIRS